MTTTITAIREQMESTVEALTPDSLSGRPFAVERAEAEFRKWAEENATACFRRFHVAQVDDVEELSRTYASELQRAVLNLVIAYPAHYALYGGSGHQSLENILHEDRIKVDAAVGLAGSSNFAADQCSSEDPSGGSIEPGVGVVFLSFLFDVTYTKAVSL